eukprot:13260332-Ditylum_brightwellii.AAC.1
MAEVEGHNGSIVLANRANEEIKNILPSDKHEDWPKDTILTGVDLQDKQDWQNTLDTYSNKHEDEQHVCPDPTTNKDLELGPLPQPQPQDIETQTLRENPPDTSQPQQEEIKPQDDKVAVDDNQQEEDAELETIKIEEAMQDQQDTGVPNEKFAEEETQEEKLEELLNEDKAGVPK